MRIPGNAQEPPGGAEDGASPAARGTFASCLPMPNYGSYEEKRVREEAATRVREEQERVSPPKRESRFGACEHPVPARQRQAGGLESQREKTREERQIVSESERERERVCFA